MLTTSRAMVTASLVCGIVGAASPARAEDVGEQPPACTEAAVRCESGEIDFWWEEAAFDDFIYDTGWVPPASNVQVRFGLTVLGRTEVGLGGWAQTSWPEPLTVATPGRPETGWLSIGYGVQLTARLRFNVTILGNNYSWEGDLPFISDYPSDLLLADDAVFDPFVLPGADPRPILVTDTTDRIRALTYDVGAIVPVPGVEGSVSLDVSALLEASYRSERIEVATEAVASEPIASEGGTTRIAAADPAGFGPAIDYSVLPVGTVDYDGGFILYPHVTVKIVGITIIDEDLAVIPVSTDLTAVEPAFESAPVHAALPDVAVAPASLSISEAAPGMVAFTNDGEASLRVWTATWPPELAGPSPIFFVAPGEAYPLLVAAAAGAEPGEVVAVLVTDDPDMPQVEIPITIVADPDDGGDDGGGDGDDGSPAGGCCRTGAGGQPGGGVLVLALFVFAAVSRRRRRCTSIRTSTSLQHR